MLNRKKLNVRIAPDLYRHLKENAPTTMTDYVETPVSYTHLTLPTKA